MTPHGLTHSEARLQAMHELEREYTATPPGGWPAAIEHRARFRHARGQWRKERNPVMPMAAE